jgi:hypothetical protein
MLVNVDLGNLSLGIYKTYLGTPPRLILFSGTTEHVSDKCCKVHHTWHQGFRHNQRQQKYCPHLRKSSGMVS